MRRHKEKNINLKVSSFFISLFFCFSASLSYSASVEGNYPSNIGYENDETIEIGALYFTESFIEAVNQERSFKGLLPLAKDDIAERVAKDQAIDLIKKSYLSYYNLKQQGPDERYSLLGATGALTEIVKGFQKDSAEKNNKIKLTKLLSKQLVQAISLSPDDSQILFSPYITHIGFGCAISKDKKKFASIIELVTKGGEFEPLKPVVNWGEKVNLSGKVKPPFKFKAISVAFLNPPEGEYESEVGFDNEALKPYFPPQAYIAYGNIAKSNLIKIIKGIGVIGAIGGAPFTGGATAILVPPLISSIQNSLPKEIPFKGGVKVNKNGEFRGQLELNYQGMNGLYFISVLGELPGINFPIVISRRVVRVNSPLVIAYRLPRSFFACQALQSASGAASCNGIQILPNKSDKILKYK